ncbi:Hypothetical predicted protein [Olea europaea subsp. europaea]|uniref:Uncharacterized protein n=1 Tax=Olea europaea subsp. europaea TaxID=158383 RepID=A0A8S0TXA0_OLEEU|nr:Hypothetical predicted protein [Olea europaea subsp. europaea]
MCGELPQRKRRDRTSAPDEAGTPGWSQERTPAAKESETQGSSTGHPIPAPDKARTQSWNTDFNTPALDEARTQGWNTSHST